MPAIQDVYSINVSNRFALAIDNEIDEGNESDNYGDFDPLDQLRLLEEQKKKDRIPKKKNKAQTQQENDKTVSSKKEVQFKENRDANVPAQKRSSGTGMCCACDTRINICQVQTTVRFQWFIF